jgi:glycosyltransferase involved in cell wall biosynthesis
VASVTERDEACEERSGVEKSGGATNAEAVRTAEKQRDDVGVALKEKPSVSVVIDSYNYGHFIEEAIESVLAQDFPAEEMEILVVDDGSTDDTKLRVAKYGERVRYLWKPNGGQASAFNFGLQQVKGELVALLDADDYWLPTKLHRVVEEFDRHPDAGLVYHRFREFVEETGESRDGPFNEVSGWLPDDRKKMLLYTACQTSGLTFRTGLVRELLPLNEGMTIQPDGLLAALIIFLGPIVAIPEPLAVYRIHGSNLYYHSSMRVDKRRQARRIETLRILLDEMDKWLVEHGYDLNRPEVLAFRRRWRLLYEKEEFLLEAPGRLRFFWHLLQGMRNMDPCLNRRIQTVNCVNAVGSLLVGYEHYDRLDGWRLRLKRLLLGAK